MEDSSSSFKVQALQAYTRTGSGKPAQNPEFRSDPKDIHVYTCCRGITHISCEYGRGLPNKYGLQKKTTAIRV